MFEISKKSQPRDIVFKLSWADLKHEWILTICLIMAIAAVLSPLLLMFGLKYGIVDWGRSYLMEDPRYSEIKLLASKSFEKDWFEQMRNRQDVDFVIPMTRQISATITAKVKTREKKEKLNIIPTDDNDPLILENGSSIPGEGECVLTRFAAEALEAEAGDIIEAAASRVRGSGYEYGVVELKVIGILSLRASGLKSMYVRLPILEAVERFKDGQAVPEFGWSGSTPKAYPQYNGLIVILPEKLDKIEEYSLCSKTGFTKIEALDHADLLTRAGFRVSPDMAVYRLYTVKKPVGEESIKSVQGRLRGKDAHLFPWISPISASLINSAGEEIAPLSLYALSAEQEEAEAVGLTPIPEWEPSPSSTRDMLKIMLPPDVSVDEKESLSVKIEKDDGFLKFPVSIMPQRTTTDKTTFLPTKLGGILKLFAYRNIRYDEDVGEFVLFRRGYAGFRMYAKTIDDVDGLRKFFEDQFIPVHTEMRDIKKVNDLDRGMTLVFWLLAAVGIAGSVASLTASLYASVERKKREMSVLRLIGLSGMKLFRFPVYQGVIIGAGGFLVSMILFEIFSSFINTWFSPYIDKLLGFPLEQGVSFCRLPFLHISAVLAGIIVIASLAATVAAFRITRIEPAEALRDE